MAYSPINITIAKKRSIHYDPEEEICGQFYFDKSKYLPSAYLFRCAGAVEVTGSIMTIQLVDLTNNSVLSTDTISSSLEPIHKSTIILSSFSSPVLLEVRASVNNNSGNGILGYAEFVLIPT